MFAFRITNDSGCFRGVMVQVKLEKCKFWNKTTLHVQVSDFQAMND